MIPVNEYQTKITEELLNSLNDEVRTELLDIINNIQFIQNLISPDRKRAKDLPRDNQGRIIVDICNPHILEDMDYFRPSAIHYQKYGKYTNLRPNGNPNSEYYKWINEEKRRCWYGMVRESDGEWIPGYYYFYLNYQPIIQTKVRKGTNQGDRIIDFPLVWEGNYLAFHYLDQARNGGKYNDFKGGNHCVEIAKRGASKAHPLDTIVPTASGFKKWEDIKIGDSLLTPDGDTTKVIDQTFFYNSSIYKVLLDNGSSVSCTRSHLFEVYVNGKKELKSLEEIIEIVTNQTDVVCELAIPKATYFSYKPVKVDSYIIGFLLCSPRVYKPVKLRKELQSINFRHNAFPKDYLFNSINNRRKLFQGLLDSKGYVENGLVKIKLTNKKVTKQVNLLIRSLGYNTEVNYENKDCLISIFTDNKLFIDDATNELIDCPDKRKINFTKITGIEFIEKKPSKCVTVDKNDGLYLVSDFIVTHNSYSLSSMMARNFILGENGQSRNKVRSVITAFEKEALTKDATLNKFVEVIDFCANNTEFPRQRLRDSISDMNWIMGYKDSEGLNKGTLNEVQGVSTNFNPDKARGKRANLFGYEEFGKFPKFIDTWTVNKPSIEEDGVVFGLGFAIGCVCAGTKVYNKYGELINIEDITKDSGILGYKNGNANIEPITYIQDPLYKECIEIQTNNRVLKCSLDHPILTRIQKSKRINSYKISNKRIRWYENKFVKSNDLKIGDFINVIDKVDIWGEDTLFDARLVGMLIGDGSYGMRKHYNKIEFKTPSFSNCDSELLDYVINNYKCNIELIRETKDNKIYKELSISELIPELKKIGIAGQSKNKKRLPINFKKLNKQNTCDLIAGLFDTDGCVYVSKSENKSHDCITLTQSSKEILEEILILLNKLGIYGKIQETVSYSGYSSNGGSKYYTLIISDNLSISNFANQINLLVNYKKDNLFKIINKLKKSRFTTTLDNTRVEKITKITNIGNQRIYNLTADDSNTYIANGIITHNTGGCVCAGTSVFNNNGEIINIENIDNTKGIIGFNIKDNIYSNENISYIQKPNSKECVRLTTNSLRTLECSIDHPIYSSTKCDSNGLRVFNWNNSGELKLGDNIAIIREIPIFGNIKIFDARLIGLLIGDGSYISSPRITSCDKEIQDYLIKNYSTTIYANKGLTKDNKLLLEIGIKNIRNELRQLGIYGQSKNNKRLPNDIFKASKKDVCDLIAGLFDTDGCISIKTNHKRPNTSKLAELKLTSSCKELLEQVRLLLIKLGIYSNIIYNKPRLYKTSKIKDVNGWFNLLISDKISIINFYTNIKLLVQYKQAKLYEAYNIVKNKKSLRKNDNIIYEKITNIENLGLRPIYNLTADNTHTYITNGIITHNTSGSDFSGALEIIYNPVGHNVYALPNVFDKNSQGKQKTVFFFGAYLNRKGFYDDNGVSDVVGALISIINARHKVKYNTSDPTIITRVKAENPITIQDAIMKIEGSSYPVAELNDRLNEIDLNPRSLDGVYTGIMSQLNGEIIFKPDYNAIPVREFPHKNNKLLGCVEIHEMPEKSSGGKVLDGRYIAGIDPYDDDESDTLSLGSIFVLDLFTDRIVCEYTGRPDFADDFYEICRKIVLFYNAETNYENNKKGLYKYFSQHNILYLLSGNLDYLRDKEGPTNTLRGNKSKGTLSSAPIKSYGRQCIRDWLIKPKEYINEDNETVTYTNLQKMNTRGLIKELILWNSNGNFDRHDAFLMLMLLREEKLRLFGTDSPQNSLIENESEYLGNDDFFKVNYEN